MAQVPIVRLSNLGPAERRAYVLADNKLAANAGWDRELLSIELQGLIDLGFDVEATGFALGEIEITVSTRPRRALRVKPQGRARTRFRPLPTPQYPALARFGALAVIASFAATPG